MKEHTISNERLAQIASEAAKKLPELIAEREALILQDYHDAVESAHDDEAENLPKLKIAFALVYDIQTSTLEMTAKWTVQRKISDTIQIEDPNQIKLNLEVVK